MESPKTPKAMGSKKASIEADLESLHGNVRREAFLQSLDCRRGFPLALSGGFLIEFPIAEFLQKSAVLHRPFETAESGIKMFIVANDDFHKGAIQKLKGAS